MFMFMSLRTAGRKVQNLDGEWQWLSHGGMKQGAQDFSVTFVLNILSNDIQKYMEDFKERLESKLAKTI